MKLKASFLKKLIYISLLFLTIVVIPPAMAQINDEAEKYLSKMLERKVPYNVKVLDIDFVINNTGSYPPGKITEIFMEYLIKNNLIKNKNIADIGAGCFALGIISAIKGANLVIGVDISEDAIKCAYDNMKLHGLKDNIYIYQENGVGSLVSQYKNKMDLVLAGMPWDTIKSEEFNNLPDNRKSLSRSFYDVDDELINSVFTSGFELLNTKNGKMFITASDRIINRIKSFCLKHHLNYKIVKEADLHNDDNLHYILEISKI